MKLTDLKFGLLILAILGTSFYLGFRGQIGAWIKRSRLETSLRRNMTEEAVWQLMKENDCTDYIINIGSYPPSQTFVVPSMPTSDSRTISYTVTYGGPGKTVSEVAAEDSPNQFPDRVVPLR